mgnify:CR=1 FL=1
MKTIINKILQKNKKRAIGLMSGTSADGIDAVIIEIIGKGIFTKYKQIAFSTYPYPDRFKELLLKNSNVKSARLDMIARLNILIGVFFAQAAKKITRQAGLSLNDIDFIGSHGQTIGHFPVPQTLYNKKIRTTLQIGHPSVIAKITGKITIGDFRIADIAVGGSGAPLVPLFDFLTFRSNSKNRLILNIGGISNITSLPKGCDIKSVLAFDTGPGNMIIDSLMMHFYKKPYDENGIIASKGKIIPALLNFLMKNKYFQIKPPKSTGREIFGQDFVKKILNLSKGNIKEDIITTVSEFTPMSIYEGYRRFIKPKMIADELFISGGGTHNSYILEALKRYFEGIRVMVTDEYNISSDAKEAICFALLASETLHGNCGNLPGATGAARETILGTISLP